MKTRPHLRCFVAVLCIATVAHAQGRRKNPTSKLFVADIVGDAQIDTGVEVDDLTKKSVYNAEGTTIETKPNSNASVVLSNGTGIYFDVNTRVEIREFQQESFRPNRSDIEDEPSLSHTRLFVDYGVLGVSTSKLVAGSTMIYETSLATAFIHGRQTVIVADDNLTVISMVQGESTVQPGPLATPRLVKNHQQIIIRRGKPGEANIVEIKEIPAGATEEDEQWLEERVLTADAACKLVYFEVQSRGGAGGDIKLFDGTGETTGDGADTGSKEIVAVPVVPATPSVQTNVSQANLITP
jgi:hypothetical protein